MNGQFNIVDALQQEKILLYELDIELGGPHSPSAKQCRRENFVHFLGIELPCPAPSQSLHRLSYSGHIYILIYEKL
jgi:hypothetical protein